MKKLKPCRCGRKRTDDQWKTCCKCRASHRERYYANIEHRREYQRKYADKYQNKHHKVCPTCRQVIQLRLQRPAARA